MLVSFICLAFVIQRLNEKIEKMEVGIDCFNAALDKLHNRFDDLSENCENFFDRCSDVLEGEKNV